MRLLNEPTSLLLIHDERECEFNKKIFLSARYEIPIGQIKILNLNNYFDSQPRERRMYETLSTIYAWEIGWRRFDRILKTGTDLYHFLSSEYSAVASRERLIKDIFMTLCHTRVINGPQPLKIVAYGLGTVAIFQALHELSEERSNVSYDLVTLGSPLWLPRIHHLTGIKAQRPDTVRRWINLWSSKDVVAQGPLGAKYDCDYQIDLKCEHELSQYLDRGFRYFPL